MEMKELTKRIKKELLRIEPEAEIYLFGSRARGDFKSDSDWDVLVLSPQKQITYDYELKLREPIFDIELETGEIISLLIYSKTDWKNKKNISLLFHQVSKEGLKI
jgi:predicted nucleotidyltransferase